jgi:uncharacterized protein (TIGR02117 family)
MARIALVLASPVALYLLAALLGSHFAANAGWKQPQEGITIYVTTNGIHSGLILPAAAAGVDWSMIARPTDLPDPKDAGDWLLFGWGDRDFYLNTPTWAEVRPATVLSALIGSGGSLVHIDHLKHPEEATVLRPLKLTPEAYRKLSSLLRAEMKMGADGYPIATPGYGSRDVFYEARSRYSLARTCNTWIADTLEQTGVRVAIWTPFSGGVTRWFPPAQAQVR